jgi:hypothetical protein
MRTTILAAALGAVPPLAGASVIEADFASVRYEGIVTSVETFDDPGPLGDYRVGDRVAGRMFVDQRRAPPDFFPEFPSYGGYKYSLADPTGRGPSFLGNAGIPSRSDESGDYAQIADGDDIFILMNGEVVFSGATFTEYFFELGVTSQGIDFVRGDSLLQTFDLSSSDLATIRAQGHLAQGTIQQRSGTSALDLIGGTIKFALTRLESTTGRCTP